MQRLTQSVETPAVKERLPANRALLEGGDPRGGTRIRVLLGRVRPLECPRRSCAGHMLVLIRPLIHPCAHPHNTSSTTAISTRPSGLHTLAATRPDPDIEHLGHRRRGLHALAP